MTLRFDWRSAAIAADADREDEAALLLRVALGF